MRSEPARFLLGLGAQKAGSSWARAYLHDDAHADFGPLKEYHIWDALTLPELAHYDFRGRSKVREYLETVLRKLLNKGPGGESIRARLQRNPDAYFQFFKTILETPGISVTGDITPAYSGLTVESLERIKCEFTKYNITTGVLFFMRDPVARCVSAVQMNRRKSYPHEGVSIIGNIDEAARRYVVSNAAHIRSDYQFTVENMRKVFTGEHIYIGFYETMFDSKEVRRLSDFATVSYRPSFATQKINQHQKTEYISSATKDYLRSELDEVYQYCARIFPETRSIWNF